MCVPKSDRQCRNWSRGLDPNFWCAVAEQHCSYPTSMHVFYPFCVMSSLSCMQSVLLNLVLAVVLEGASDQMKEKHAAQQFRDNTLRLFHNQYKRLAIRRWSAKVRAETLLKRGVCDAIA